MGSVVSHLVGCFAHPRSDNYPVGGGGLQFSEPLDGGLGHSFCYVRPPPVGGSPPDKLEEFSPMSSAGKQGLVTVGGEDAYVDTADVLSSLSQEEKENSFGNKSRSFSLADKPRHSFEKPKSATNGKVKVVSETSFKAISGASVSANTTTPRTMISSEQFNSFSNVLYDRAAAFESTSSFSAIPLQPVPRGFSGPLLGPLDRGDRGFMSGPLERERGFMSGPLERGFMSGPLERGGDMSGPLDTSVDCKHFSAPLNGPYHDSGYFRKRKETLVQFMTNMSGPMKKAFVKTASSLVKTHKYIVAPVKSYMQGRESSKEGNDSICDKEKRIAGPRKGGFHLAEASVEFSSSELDVRESDNLQWAQGKAGEDRVHVVISEEQGWIFVGIYDGFNGPDAPDFLMSNLYPAVSQELQGLLWDPKEDESSVPVDEAEGIEESGEQEMEGGEQQVYDEKVDCWRSQRACWDMIEIGEREHGDFGVRNVGQDRRGSRNLRRRTEEKSPNEMEGSSKEDIPRLSLDDSSPVKSSDEMSEFGEEPQSLVGAHSEPGATRNWGADSFAKGTRRYSRQEEPNPNAKPGGGGWHEEFGNEHEGKLADDCGNGQVDDVENERSSNQPEFSEASSVYDQDHKEKMKRATPGVKPCHGHDRRKEQLHKYFQWRYDWDQEKSGGIMQKVITAKVARKPDSLGKEKAVEHACVLKALSRALEATENAYLEMADKVLYENPELALMGSCVLVMLMKDEDVYILNVGDSRAILAQHPKVEPLSTGRGQGGWNGLHRNDSGARDSLLRLELERIIEETPMELEALEAAYEHGSEGTQLPSEPSLLGALQLTTDHSTNVEEEVLRLRAEHPDDDIIENDRVKGKLKVTRAFGAGFLKQPKWNNALLEMFQINFIGTIPYMTCSPALYHHRLGPQDEFLVLSSDGLYQYFSSEEVVSQVEWFMKKFPDGDPAQRLVEELLFRAAEKAGMDFHELLDIPQGDRRKYHDDVSVIVISLEGRIWQSSG